jgi:hypothetical protein
MNQNNALSNLFFKQVKSYISIVLVFLAVFQCIFFFSFENNVLVIVILTSYKLYDITIFNFNRFYRYPISSFLIFGYFMTQYFFPLLFTTLEFKKVSFNLNAPLEVSIHSLFTLISLILANLTYVNLCGYRRNSKITLYLKHFGLFKLPSNPQIWFLGYLGLLCMVYTSLIVGSESGGNVFQKFMKGLNVYAYAPFFIIIKNLLIDKKTTKKTYYYLIIFVFLIIIISVAKNARGSMLYGFAGLGFAFSLFRMLGLIKFKIFSKKTVFYLLLGVYLITGPLDQLSSAMLNVRDQRSNISSTELILMTFEAYFNEDLIIKKKSAVHDSYSIWDEHYLNNTFLARFSNLKFNDLSLEQANKIGTNSDFRMYDFHKMAVVLPQPLLSLFDIKIDKGYVNSMSRGDMLLYTSAGAVGVLGGFRVGHFSGIGMVSFGWYYLLVFYVFLIPLFYLLDSFVYKEPKGKLIISFLIIINFKFVFMYFPIDGVFGIGNYILRGWLESIVTYLLVIKLSNLFLLKKN